MSWLSPDNVPNDVPGTCVLHRAGNPDGDFSHVTWSGTHEILIPDIVANTPEIQDGTVTKTISGNFCATAGCQCGLQKLSDAVGYVWHGGSQLHGFPAASAPSGNCLREMHEETPVRPSPTASGSRSAPPPAADAAEEVAEFFRRRIRSTEKGGEDI
jgi:hypothetical protein